MAVPPQYLHIRLEGAFCVVIQKNNGYRVRACTIVDRDHKFAINGSPIDYKPGNSFYFQLKPDGLETYSIPQIDPAFDWSNKSTDNWQNDDDYYFISMDLPCPKQIMQDCTARVTFADDQKGLMPQDHILVYEIMDPNKLQITCEELGPQTIDASGNFSLEIGLPPHTPSQTVHDHALMFYNGMLQKLFPDLARYKSCVLKDIEVDQTRTTTFECKSGGMIVSYP